MAGCDPVPAERLMSPPPTSKESTDMSAISLRTPEFITFTSLDASGLGHGGAPGLVTWSSQPAQR
ncbi:hypothetical protein D9623_28670 (plasmid) [Azospirillum brasilense]|uniref:Uncharacterized protein n=2 Tax=Azospirillum brasilense TaxID=192 RepID=A0A4D8QV45_AZOBR|nr:hypothetical protein FE88_03515 [Azospirillum brasilense]QCO12513.1 hypothetical protein D3868_26025 [Azospirillum brasilense]QEL94056.1 hypothetical protein D9621_28450 [Azospirillum brasilense]QEM00362.1 hypothetical protein D9623_28670 [Azospirillum brasilense]